MESTDRPERIDQTPDPRLYRKRIVLSSTIYMDDLEDIYEIVARTQREEDSRRLRLKKTLEELQDDSRASNSPSAQWYEDRLSDPFYRRPMVMIEADEYRFRSLDQLRTFNRKHFKTIVLDGESKGFRLSIDALAGTISITSNDIDDRRAVDEIAAILKQGRFRSLKLGVAMFTVFLFFVLPVFYQPYFKGIGNSWSYPVLLLVAQVIMWGSFYSVFRWAVWDRSDVFCSRYKDDASSERKLIDRYGAPILVGVVLIVIAALIAAVIK